MDLRHLTDKTLLADTKKLCLGERELSTKILHHLKEIDRRKLFSDIGHGSLFAYCTKDLGYTESEALRRIKAARVLKELPQIESKIEDGSLSLTNVSMLEKFFKNHDVTSEKDKMEVVAKVENLSTRECEKELFQLSGQPEPEIKDKKTRISSTKTRFSFTLTEETQILIDELKNLLHRSCTFDELIKFMAVRTIKEIKKEKFKLTKSKGSPSAQHVNRVIPASVKREVYLRDKKCTKCGSTHRLQYDHRKPYSLGGNSSAENIRLLCFSCNQRARMRAKL